MKWLVPSIFLLATPAFAIDPLSAQFQPSIDKNANDYTTALGSITITDSLFKVWQSSPAPGSQKWIQIYLMKNEWQSFQVHVTPSVNVSSLSVSMSNLVDTQTVPSSIIYATSTNMTVYREFYMDIATPTALSTVTYSGGARAYMPDQLIPAVDPYWGQTISNFATAVNSAVTQSFWIDVHIPTTSPSGFYSGSVYVSSGNVVVSTMPVVYAVWAWTIPSTATFGTIGAGFGYNGFNNIAYGTGASICPYPGAADSCDTANIYEWIDGAVQMLDNRWTIDEPNYVYPGAGSFTNYVNLIGPLINGTAAHVSTILPGAALTRVGLWDTSFTSGIWSNWETNYESNGWFPRLFYYLADEPSGGAAFAEIISSSTATRTWSSPPIPNLVTTDIATANSNGATNYIDWMTPIIENLDTTASGNLRSNYNTYLSTSVYGITREIGSYQDCESAGTCSQGTIGPANTPAYPNRHIDGQPVANRAFETWAFLNNLNYELYFAVDICDTSHAGYPCASTYNPWSNVYAFGCNGDGTLMYPSTSTVVTFSVASSTPIWIPSMRLKYFRDGEQDYEYENYLTQTGSGSYVTSQINNWMTNGYTFNVSTAGIETARFNMGQAIHQLTYPSGGGGGASSQTSIQLNGSIMLKGNVRFQ